MINGYEMATGGEFVMAGYLIKSPPDNKPMAQWHRRWFLLMDSRLVYPLADRFVRLEYYQSEAEARRFADPKGVIMLNSCHLIHSREPVKGHKFVFDVCTAERIYHLAAESAEEKKNWLQTLNNLLFSEDSNCSAKEASQAMWSTPENRKEEVLLRVDAKKYQRPQSHTGSSSSNEQRPLPPIPSITQSRPLPTPPVAPKQKRGGPPAPPPPYHSTHSPTPPPPVDISGHYEVATTAAPVAAKPVLYRKPKKSASLDLEVASEDSTYSVLEQSNTPGYDPTNAEYSHLQTDQNLPLAGLHIISEPATQHRKSGYENVPRISAPDNYDDYSRLEH